MEFAKDYLKLLSHGLSKIPLKNFEAIARILLQAYERDRQVFILGNGGSAAIASHMACDLGKGTLTNVYDPKEKRFRVISLADNMPLFSALANDIGYDHVFEQQLQNLVQPGDVVVGISCSGNSPNVLNALKLAKQKAAITIGFVGFDGGVMKVLCDHVLHFEEKHYQRCEDAFSIFQHMITSCIAEKKKMDNKRASSKKSQTISIQGTKKVIGGEDVFIIAEIGKNFIQTQEDQSVTTYLKNAKALVDAAIRSGADAVKFQTHDVEDEQIPLEVVSPHFPLADRYAWIKRNTEATPAKEFWQPLRAYCKRKGIIFFSTPMSRKAAQKLEAIGVPLWKVGSGDVQDYILLDFLAETKKPVIISTGMVSLAELDETIRYFRNRHIQTVVLYCVSQYPAPPEKFNLATIEYLHEKYPDVVIGFSDHSLGYDIPLVAVKLGAKVIEKHFSLSRDLWGPDHKVSMTPEEFGAMVRLIRNQSYRKVSVQPFYGKKNLELDGKKNKYRFYFNKSLVAGKSLSRGMILKEDMIFAMRPHGLVKGLPANKVEGIIGKKLKQDIFQYTPFSPTLFE